MSEKMTKGKGTEVPAVQQPSATIVPDFLKGKIGGVLKGLEKTTRDDYIIPRYNLMQMLTDDVIMGEATAGSFVNSALPVGDAKREVKQLDCYLLGIGIGRVHWQKPFKKGQSPLCRSNDGKVSVDGKIKCAKCEHSMWVQGPDGNTCACPPRYVWAAVDRDTMTPFTINAAGSSVRSTKNILSWFQFNQLPPYVVKMKISAKRESNDRGTYFVLEYTPVKNEDGSIAFVDNAAQCAELEKMTDVMMGMMDDTIVARDIDVDATGGIVDSIDVSDEDSEYVPF